MVFGTYFQLYYYSFEDNILFESPNLDNYEATNTPSIYSNLMRGVIHSSLTIDKCESLKHTTRGNEILGEALFLRGLFSFYLGTCFNNPPVHPNTDKYPGTGNFNDYFYEPGIVHYETKEAHYLAAIQDLTDAQSYLSSEKDQDNPWRPNIWSCKAFLGKVFLYNQNFDDAQTLLEEVINSDQYDLTTASGNSSKDSIFAYLSNFSWIDLQAGENTYQSEYNSESVFEIDYTTGYNLNPYLPGVMASGNILSQWYSPHTTSFKNVEVHPKLIDVYEPGDIRLKATVYMKGDTMDFREEEECYKAFKCFVNIRGIAHSREIDLPDGVYGYGLKKYYFPVYNGDEGIENSPNNWRLLRYSDVLLMHAEACFHLKEDDKGLTSLNIVRERAGLDSLPEITKESIMQERNAEFAGECIRFHDLIRWSELPEPWVDLPEVLGDHFTINEDEHLPIPSDYLYKIQLSNNEVNNKTTLGEKVGTLSISNIDNNNIAYQVFEYDRELNSFYNMNGFYIEDNELYHNNLSDYNAVTGIKVVAKDENWKTYSELFDIYILENITYTQKRSQDDMNYSVFPNPSDGQINITTNLNGDTDVSVYNSSGKMIYKKIDYRSIHLEGLKSGIYFIKIENYENNVCEIHKLIMN
jgi:hypothetical protein